MAGFYKQRKTQMKNYCFHITIIVNYIIKKFLYSCIVHFPILFHYMLRYIYFTTLIITMYCADYFLAVKQLIKCHTTYTLTCH